MRTDRMPLYLLARHTWFCIVGHTALQLTATWNNKHDRHIMATKLLEAAREAEVLSVLDADITPDAQNMLVPLCELAVGTAT